MSTSVVVHFIEFLLHLTVYGSICSLSWTRRDHVWMLHMDFCDQLGKKKTRSTVVEKGLRKLSQPERVIDRCGARLGEIRFVQQLKLRRGSKPRQRGPLTANKNRANRCEKSRSLSSWSEMPGK